MKSIYKFIGELVERIDQRNTDGTVTNLIGVSIDKKFINSVANVIGTDLTKYKVIEKYDFAVSLMQVSRDEKIPIACQKEYDKAIMSPAYPIFRVKDTSVVLPEYLEMWFMRPEFDREASFIAVGGVRGSMPWEDFANMKLPVPSIEEQREIVNSYNAITDRIALKKQINDNLEATVQNAFNAEFIAFVGNNSSLVDTELGQMPENLLVKLVSEIEPRIESGKRPSGGAASSGYPSLGADCAKGLGCYDRSKAKYVPFDFAQKMTKGIVKGYELLAYKDGGKPSEFIPEFSIYGEGYPFDEFAINEHVFIIDFGCPEANWFAYFLFKSKYVYNLLASVGGKSAIPGINQQDIGNLYVIDPTSEAALEFGAKYLPFLKAILINCKELLKLEELKDSVLTTLSR